jgi:2-polyprenyl-3-methyl-5-hydroxy-6-metoxy-1,4-benzoquinol methylase
MMVGGKTERERMKSAIMTAQAAPASGQMESVDACCVCQSRDVQLVDPECNLCRCRRCGYVFDNPRPSQEEIIQFYSRTGKYDSWVRESDARDGLWKRRLKMLLPHRAEGNLLDIGTGIGQFLERARPYFADLAGTEISSSAARVARERYGLEIYTGRAEKLSLPAGSFDNITLFHVLEHVPDPAMLARKCQELLKPGGVLVIAVPNDVLAWGSGVKRLGRKLGLKPFQKFSAVLGTAKAGASREIHLSHFTPVVLRMLVRNSGFEIMEEGLDPYYAASGLMKAAHDLYYWLHRMLFTMTGANRYETIWMVARKAAA